MDYPVNSYNGDGVAKADHLNCDNHCDCSCHVNVAMIEEKVEYVYQFCKTLEEMFDAFSKSPMSKMMPGMPNLKGFSKGD
jgi:hypothetical protein